jgi:quinohemoprotein amine dehydrogenase
VLLSEGPRPKGGGGKRENNEGSISLLPRLTTVLAFGVLVAGVAPGQFTRPLSEEGIPIEDPLVVARCGKCHASDERGNMQRISWARATPEGWQNAVKRMVLLNGVSLTAPEARQIVKYLSSSHGLAPEEARSVMYNAERRIREASDIPNDRLRNTCANCHAFAVPLSWRRSPGDWKAFIDSHAARQKFQPNEEAIAFFARSAPLHTPEWEAWKTRTGTLNPTGRWLVTAWVRGRGTYCGDLRVERADDEEFITRVNLTSLRDGSRIERTGRSAVYGDYAWRGRSRGVDPAAPSAPDDLSSEAREVLWIAPDHARAEGRWFWGQYQEFGVDVQLQRASSKPTLLAIDRSSLKAGSRGNIVRLIGDNFPARVTPADLDFGPGVIVRRIVSNAQSQIVAEVDAAADAQLGKHAVAFLHSVLPGALAIYDRVDYIKVVPESAVASFGDNTYPRGYMQFEAIGYQRGPDGKLHTADDLALGPVDVTWSMQVFHAAEGSSADFVGKVSAAGLLTPASDKPDNNFDVWAIATAKSEKNKDGIPLVGKSYVVVTVAAYTFSGRRYVRDLDRWVDDGPASGEEK